MKRVFCLVILASYIGIIGLDAKALAYLFDSSGEVSLVRGTDRSKIFSSCLPLLHGDTIELGAASSARVVYPALFFALQGPHSYLVNRSYGVQLARPDGSLGKVSPLTEFRGQGKGSSGTSMESLVFPPTKLFSQVKPPIFREKPLFHVLSPLGTVYSKTPTILWEKTKEGEVEISIKSLGEEVPLNKFPWIKVKGSQVSWKSTGWPTLNLGDLYLLRIRRDGKLITGEETAFWILDEDGNRGTLDADLATIGQVFPDCHTRKFLEANVLFQRGCFAEARLLAHALVLSEPTNFVYLKLLQRCSAELGFKEEFEALEKRVISIASKK